jgi:hypothetical protein
MTGGKHKLDDQQNQQQQPINPIAMSSNVVVVPVSLQLSEEITFMCNSWSGIVKIYREGFYIKVYTRS